MNFNHRQAIGRKGVRRIVHDRCVVVGSENLHIIGLDLKITPAALDDIGVADRDIAGPVSAVLLVLQTDHMPHFMA